MVARAHTREQAIATIANLRDDLNKALDEIEEQRNADEISITHQSFLNDYAVVRMAGFLEQLCFNAISGRIGEATGGHLQTFVDSWFYKSPNLTAPQFRDLFKRFGSDVDDEILRFLGEQLNRELLNSLLETRNAVAHGKEYSRAGRESLRSYRTLVADVDELVHNLLLSDEPVISR